VQGAGGEGVRCASEAGVLTEESDMKKLNRVTSQQCQISKGANCTFKDFYSQYTFAMQTDLTIPEAIAALHTVLPRLQLETVPLLQAAGRRLAADLHSLVNHPNTDDSALDGYAVRLEETVSATPQNPVRLLVVGEVAAGAKAHLGVLETGQAVKVFTGGAVPKGATGIAAVEHTTRDGEFVLLWQPAQAEIRRTGQDLEAGQVYLKKGTRLDGASLALAAAMGHPLVTVFERPKVAILSTGDEIYEPGEPLPEGAVYNAGSYGLYAKLLEMGAEPVLLPKVEDNIDSLYNAMISAKGAHLLLTIGGVSMGERDFVRKLLETQGIPIFWRVKIKPGGPPMLGLLEGMVVFGLPGNPVSSLVVFDLVVRSALLHAMGAQEGLPTMRAKAGTPFKSAGAKQGLWRANLTWAGEHYSVAAFSNQSSQVLRSLVQSNALAVVPPNQSRDIDDWLEVLLINDAIK
jgi:molybdopterin molybdotransferase